MDSSENNITSQKLNRFCTKHYEDETLCKVLRKMDIEKKARVQAHDYRESWGENDKNFYWVLYHHSYAAWRALNHSQFVK